MDSKRLKELVDLMNANGLVELEVEAKGFRARLRKGSAAARRESPLAAAGAAPPLVPASAPPAQPDGLLLISSPMVGTFYHAPRPDADPFVEVGDRVNEETVVCIIEAMKVMNEIKAEVKGTIEAILVNNGDAVEFGRPLFRVRPEA